MTRVPLPSKPVVLVVEDEPFILSDAVMMIQDAGFEAIEANSADEAIDILNARSDIRVVFTDIEMPGSMDGLKLARVVREKWPPVELIVTSGKRNLANTDLPARGRFVGKPYDARQVTDDPRVCGIGALSRLSVFPAVPCTANSNRRSHRRPPFPWGGGMISVETFTSATR